MKSLLTLLRHFLLPHHSNNQRAKLLHHESVLVIAICLLVSGFLLSHLKVTHPRVLGSAVDISSEELVLLTNQARAKEGVGPLTLNDQLSNSAHADADYMFAKNYWAHIAPDGTTPWEFIKTSGYSYVFAGQNLARGYNTSSDVINAWLESPDHRANMLSKNYEDVGFAVEKGNLTGESDTVLVVEMFGGKNGANLTQTKTSSPANPARQTVLAEGSTQQQTPIFVNAPVINTFAFARNITLFLLAVFILVFVIDAVFIQKKKIFRIVGHNMDHVLFLSGVVMLIVLLARGTIY